MSQKHLSFQSPLISFWSLQLHLTDFTQLMELAELLFSNMNINIDTVHQYSTIHYSCGSRRQHLPHPEMYRFLILLQLCDCCQLCALCAQKEIAHERLWYQLSIQKDHSADQFKRVDEGIKERLSDTRWIFYQNINTLGYITWYCIIFSWICQCFVWLSIKSVNDAKCSLKFTELKETA